MTAYGRQRGGSIHPRLAMILSSAATCFSVTILSWSTHPATRFRLVLAHDHIGEENSEIRPVDAELLLHRTRCQPDRDFFPKCLGKNPRANPDLLQWLVLVRSLKSSDRLG